jgi:short-subunit dehydrogenase
MFQERYGPWAVVAGATEGIGRAFSRGIAKRGINVVLTGRREELLDAVSLEIRTTCKVGVLPLPLDLSKPSGPKILAEKTADLEVGLLVYNAALSDPGPFLERSEQTLEKLVQTNCAGPLLLCRFFGEKMADRKRGGIILMSSMSGFQGTPYVAAYGASKAFNLVLAEGLWYELGQSNVDVLACCPGPTDTPGFNSSLEGEHPPAFPPVLSPDQVAEESLKNLGKKSVLVPARINRFASFFIQKLLPRRTGVKIMGKSTGRMYGREGFGKRK